MLTVTAANYWNEIEATNLSTSVKGILKSLVNSYLHDTIPAQLSQHEKVELAKAEITEVEIQDTENRSTAGILTIMHFVPNDKELHREFLYLAKHYPNGCSKAFNK